MAPTACARLDRHEENADVTPQQIKKALADAGFLVFRTLGDEIVLAERVRENLIMDSGVRLRASSPLQVRIVLKAQRGDFPGEEEARLFDRVRELAGPAISDGFKEVDTAVVPVPDPTDERRTLDTFYEIVLAKDAAGLDVALDGVRFALTLEKMVAQKH
jgi:hypothetical protein